MEDQTKNRIREESLDYLVKDFIQSIQGSTIEWQEKQLKSFIDELLKSQREELVKKIEKISDFADSGDTLKSRIINLIKNN